MIFGAGGLGQWLALLRARYADRPIQLAQDLDRALREDRVGDALALALARELLDTPHAPHAPDLQRPQGPPARASPAWRDEA